MARIPIRKSSDLPAEETASFIAPRLEEDSYAWTVSSFSKAGRTWIVSLDPLDREQLPWQCNCPAWHADRRPVCKHIAHIQEVFQWQLLKMLTDGYLTKEQVELLDADGCGPTSSSSSPSSPSS